MQSQALTFIGCGNMAQAIINQLQTIQSLQIYVVDPSEQAQAFCETFKQSAHLKCQYFKCASSYQQHCLQHKVIIDDYILAIKPQILQAVAQEWQNFFAHNFHKNKQHIISILAGINCKTIQQHFTKPGQVSTQLEITRVMPNLCLAVGYGVNGIYIDRLCQTQQNKIVSLIKQYFGQSNQYIILDDENKMHAFTALFGSGPAYLFLILEYLQKAMQTMHLNAQLTSEECYHMLYHLLIGSAITAQQSLDTPAQLREKVTSKGGTTEAALSILMNGQLQNLLDTALKKAIERSQTL
jgi:pyrroline-5-carboxylate reductase